MNCFFFFCQQGQTHTARCQKHQTASLQLLRLQLSWWPHCPIYCHSDVEQSQEKFFHEWKEENTHRVFALGTNQRELTRVET